MFVKQGQFYLIVVIQYQDGIFLTQNNKLLQVLKS